MEFALIIPIVLLLIVVVFDLGRAIYAQHTIGNAARGGARVAIVDQTPSKIDAGARERAVGLTASELMVVPTYCVSPKIGCEIQVKVTYRFEPITPLVGAILGPMTLESTTTMPVERVYAEPAP